MTHLFPIVLFAALLLTTCATADDKLAAAERTFRQLAADEAITLMKNTTDYVILDVRTPEEFAEKHIPDALNVPNETIGTEPIAALPDKDQLILVYCRSGNRSKQAAEKLVTQGYTNVVEFGGINAWPGEVVAGAK